MSKRLVLAVSVFSIVLAVISLKPLHAQQGSEWRFPAEFEKQKMVWLGWLSTEYIGGYKTDTVFLPIVKALAPRVKVCICVPQVGEMQRVKELLTRHSVLQDNISFYVILYNQPYWRDFGPIFTVDAFGNKSVADFNFNTWGYFSDTHIDSRILERVDRTVAKYLGIPSRMTRIASEGGGREFNGRGTVMLTEACEFQRNPNVSRAQIQTDLTEMLGVTNFIWLKHGTVEDDPYNTSTLPGPKGEGVAYRSASANNHVDEYCRFVSPDTILLAEVTEEEAARGPMEAENRRRMEENYNILKNARDQDGNPFKIIRIPMPETLYFTATPEDQIYTSLAFYANYVDGTEFPYGEPIHVVPAQSYCNFLISNGVVLAQKYWRDGMPETVRKKDQAALKVLREAFPDRKVVAINTIPLNFGGGGIHCATQQEPVEGKSRVGR